MWTEDLPRINFLMQFQADMLDACINRSDIEEASAMGAMIMNGLARKVWKDMDEVAALRTSDNRIFRPCHVTSVNAFMLVGQRPYILLIENKS